MTPETRAFIQGHAQAIFSICRRLDSRGEDGPAQIEDIRIAMRPYGIERYLDARVPPAIIEAIQKFLVLA